MADLVGRDTPVKRIVFCQPLSDEGVLNGLWRLLQKLLQAVLKPDGPVPPFTALTVWVGH